MISRRLHRFANSALAIAVMTAFLAPGTARSATVTGTPQLTATDLNAFLDGFMPESIARADIAGATVSVVKDGKLVTVRNYGYADVKARRPVTDTTLFRPGSISKLFTWTAVMQQVERGKIDLDRDVNDYLDFKIPPAFGKPITMRDLMTHTPGFAEVVKDLIISNPAQLTSLDVYLKTHVPARIFAPGTTVAYSNYGAALAGYIVQRVSGVPFDQYVEENIFKPLGMSHSTMQQPTPKSLAPFVSNGYAVASGPVIPFEYVQAWPAGSLSATSSDMAKFMIAHLQNGQLGSGRILKPQTARLMHTLQRRDAPGMPGYALGFYQEDRNGQVIIGHAGDTEAFHSDLHLLLDANVGFFVSFNSLGKEGASGSLRTELFDAFLDRYFPAPLGKEATAPTAKADAKVVPGWYISSRREDGALSLLFALTEAHVVAQPDGTITVSLIKDPAGQLKHFREVGPLLYREVGGKNRVAFVRTPDGGMYFTTDSEPPVFIFSRVPWWKQWGVVQVLLACAFVIFVVTLLLWPIAALIRWYYHQPLNLPRTAALLRLLTRIACAIVVLTAVGWLVAVTALGKGDVPAALLAFLFILGWICVIGAIVMIANAVVAWRTPGRTIVGRIGETLPALAGVVFAWAILAFGLASFNMHY
jgi:CubicO group peptidase (beta-lactamase class C family)